MRIQHLLAFAGAAFLSLTACADPNIVSAPNAASDTVLAQTVFAPGYRLTPDEATHMQGAFKLDDGRVMKVSSRGSHLFVELDGKREELMPAGAKGFVARDSGTRVAFDRVPFAEEAVVSQAR